MNFDDVVLKRRSIRKYLSDDVDIENIYEIIKSGLLAPSAMNRQPWKVKILSKAEKEEVYKALLSKKNFHFSIENTANIINEAPCLIAIFYDKEDESNRDHDMLSLGAFIENMHLKATEMGFGSLWIANTDRIKKEINDITGVSLECISTFAIGYKNQEPDARPRKSIEEIIL